MNNCDIDFDVIGIGFGPANIAIAIVLEELNLPLKVKFFEREQTTIWQKGMLFKDTDVQNHPLRDLVTPRNPRSRFTFTNYLFENGRLFEHLNLGMTFPYRIEYALYIEWVASHFSHLVSYGTQIDKIEMLVDASGYGSGYRLQDSNGNEYTAKSLILATGRTPFIPEPFQRVASSRICHISHYLESVEKILSLKPRARIAVVGSSQSAAEVILHLSDNYAQAEITGVMRSFGYRLKDTSPFTGEVYFPDFVDLYFDASDADKSRLNRDLYYTNYGAVDGDVLDRLYRKMYMQKVTGSTTIFLHRLADILEVKTSDRGAILVIKKMEAQAAITEHFDLIILATGFKNIGTNENEEKYQGILKLLLPFIERDDNGCIKIDYNYRLKMQSQVDGRACCFLNGLCESTHGMGDAGSFSLLSLRSKTIVDALLASSTALHTNALCY